MKKQYTSIFLIIFSQYFITHRIGFKQRIIIFENIGLGVIFLIVLYPDPVIKYPTIQYFPGIKYRDVIPSVFVLLLFYHKNKFYNPKKSSEKKGTHLFLFKFFFKGLKRRDQRYHLHLLGSPVLQGKIHSPL